MTIDYAFTLVLRLHQFGSMSTRYGLPSWLQCYVAIVIAITLAGCHRKAQEVVRIPFEFVSNSEVSWPDPLTIDYFGPPQFCVFFDDEFEFSSVLVGGDKLTVAMGRFNPNEFMIFVVPPVGYQPTNEPQILCELKDHSGQLFDTIKVVEPTIINVTTESGFRSVEVKSGSGKEWIGLLQKVTKQDPEPKVIPQGTIGVRCTDESQ